MSTAKDIVIKVIDSLSAKKIVQMYHYSGKTTQNSQIHFGVFINGSLQGALQFGPSIDKRRMAQNLGIGFNESLELNRMALSDRLPKFSESRSIGICLRMLKKQYPFLKLIISFADACQCGDGTIYRASGFKLHSFKKNNSLLSNGDGKVVADKSLNDIFLPNGQRLTSILKSGDIIAKKSMDNIFLSNGKYLSSYLLGSGIYKPIEGYQMKYLYFFDKELEKKFTFVEFDKIPDSVRMYKGIKRAEHENNATGFQSEEGGATPTDTLQL
jgi:hypothetical protein